MSMEKSDESMAQTKKTEITKIYFITHPGFNYLYGGTNIDEFIRTAINPVIKRAQAEPNSLIILLKTPKILLGDKDKRAAAEKKLESAEEKIEELTRRMMKRRGIILYKTSNPFSVAENIQKISKARGFQINPGTHIEGYGSWRSLCAHTSPEAFRELAGISRRISVQIHGTLTKPKKRRI